MEISKSTPYVRYTKQFTSNLHLGAIHIQSEYLDRERKTTLDSIQGMTWQNKVVNENKVDELVAKLDWDSSDRKSLTFESNTKIDDTIEQKITIDEIHGNSSTPTVNEDGTYTYTISTREGVYPKTYNGHNHFITSSEGIQPNMHLEVNSGEAKILTQVQGKDVTIEQGIGARITTGKLHGDTLVNRISKTDTNMVLHDSYTTTEYNMGQALNTITVNGGMQDLTKNNGSMILKGQTMVNILNNYPVQTYTFNGEWQQKNIPIKHYDNRIKPNTDYTFVFHVSSLNVSDETKASIQIGDDHVFNDPTNLILKKGVNTYKLRSQPNISQDLRLFTTVWQTSGTITFTLMLLEGDFTNQDIPYFEGIQSVESPTLKTCGKNLANLGRYNSDYKNVNASSDGKMIRFNSQSHGSYCAFDLMTGVGVNQVMGGNQINIDYAKSQTLVEGKGYYTLSFDTINNASPSITSVGIFYDDGKFKNATWGKNYAGHKKTTVEVKNKINFISIDFWYNSSPIDVTLNNIQLEVGETETTYEPHKSNFLTLPQDLTLREMKGLQDVLDCSTSEKVQRVGEYQITGEEGWWFEQSQRRLVIRPTFTPNIKCGKFACDKLEAKQANDMSLHWTNGTYYIGYTSDGWLRIILGENLTSLEQGKEWLRNNKPVIQYELTKPIIEKVNLSIVDQDNKPSTLHTFNGTSYITLSSSNGLLPSTTITHDSTVKVDTLCKPSTPYTLIYNRVGTASLTFSIGETSVTVDNTNTIDGATLITTGATVDNLVMKGEGNTLSNVMLIEGDVRSRANEIKKLGYWEGFKDVTNPRLDIEGESQATRVTTLEPIKLAKIGSAMDELDLGKECVVENVGKFVIDHTFKTGNYDSNRKLFAINGHDGVENWNGNNVAPICDKLPTLPYTNFDKVTHKAIAIHGRSYYFSGFDSKQDFLDYVSVNPLTIYYPLATPKTTPVTLIKPNSINNTSVASITLTEPLNRVGDVSDFIAWNPYKGHYCRYSYIQNGVAQNKYLVTDLTTMTDRKSIKLYNDRTYVSLNSGDNSFISRSNGISKYVLIEGGKDYYVSWAWTETPTCETLKINLGGTEVVVPSSTTETKIHVPAPITNSLVSISGVGFTGNLTRLMVIECKDNGEKLPKILPFFEGDKSVGETVNIGGQDKVQVDVITSNGNLWVGSVGELRVVDKGNSITSVNDKTYPILPNTSYVAKFGENLIGYIYLYNAENQQTRMITVSKKTRVEFTTGLDECQFRFYFTTSNTNNANVHFPFELCYADMERDDMRQSFYNSTSLILPQKLHRIDKVCDSFSWNQVKGCYVVLQQVGHKWFNGADVENWILASNDNNKETIDFIYQNADISYKANGELMCNSFRLVEPNRDVEGFYIDSANQFVLRMNRERLSAPTVLNLKLFLAKEPIHLYYQLSTPLITDLTEYNKPIGMSTYQDEFYSCLSNTVPTTYQMAIPLDQTYRFNKEMISEGLANRITVTDERRTDEDCVAIVDIKGLGIANIVEDPNNVPTMLYPNYEGVSTSHTLTNSKVGKMKVYGFEASTVGTSAGMWNSTNNRYEIKVMTSNSNDTSKDYHSMYLPFKLNKYSDTIKDKVEFLPDYGRWYFSGDYEVPVEFASSTGMFKNAVEIMRGVTPTAGLIAEFKVRFVSGTASARFYYSLNGNNYTYSTLRNMIEGEDYYIGVFCTGGTKIDIATKIGASSQYDRLVPLSQTIPDALYVNQIQGITQCTHHVIKNYLYQGEDDITSPIELDTYDGTTKVYIDGNTTDTNIIIKNSALKHTVDVYDNEQYTIYWKHISGEGDITLTLGGTTQSVPVTQEYCTLTTQSKVLEDVLLLGGFNCTIQEVMVIKGARINDLAYFEGSRQVGDLLVDERGKPILNDKGEKQYKIRLVLGHTLTEQDTKDKVKFADTDKHHVVIDKLLGSAMDKID